MVRILLIPIMVVLVIAGILYYRFVYTNKNLAQPVLNEVPAQLPSSPVPFPTSSGGEPDIALLASQINSLKAALDNLSQVVSQKQTGTVTESRIQSLEASLANLTSRISVLENSSKTTTSTTSSKAPLYIPLGSGGNSSGDRNFVTLPSYQVSIDPGNYPGYTSMQLEVNMKLEQSVGIANARLYNSSDNSAISATASTTSSQYITVSSGTFTLPSGNKTYILQVQSTEGYQLTVSNARIKVNF